MNLAILSMLEQRSYLVVLLSHQILKMHLLRSMGFVAIYILNRSQFANYKLITEFRSKLLVVMANSLMR